MLTLGLAIIVIFGIMFGGSWAFYRVAMWRERRRMRRSSGLVNRRDGKLNGFSFIVALLICIAGAVLVVGLVLYGLFKLILWER